MIVTIDGPAGAGKSTVTRELARELGFQYLDTGAMYRAVTWSAMQQEIDLDDGPSLVKVARDILIEFDGDQVIVNGTDASEAIREPAVTRNVGKIADLQEIRQHLVDLQRRIASQGDFICEGRDQGTVAFPDAFCKIYLTASKLSRAKRRFEQLQAAGQFADYDQVVRDQEVRDHRDANRPFGRLCKAEDAVEFNTDKHSITEVVSQLAELIREKMEGQTSTSR